MIDLMKKQCKHDMIVIDLADLIRKTMPRSKVKTFFYYPHGEVDIMQYYKAEDKFYFNNYEIKCADHIHAREKAREQLARFHNYLNQQFGTRLGNVNSYYVHGVGNSYMIHNINTYEEVTR